MSVFSVAVENEDMTVEEAGSTDAVPGGWLETLSSGIEYGIDDDIFVPGVEVSEMARGDPDVLAGAGVTIDSDGEP